MNLNSELAEFIETRLKRCEQQYKIEIMAWAVRGSLSIGIYRKNSDLDLIFLYKCHGEKISGIHDIVGYGLDFWGWDIQDAMDTLILNHEKFYEKPADFKKRFTLSPQHARGSLDYFHGFYCFLGNKDAFYNSKLFLISQNLFKNIMEIKVLLSNFILRLNSFSTDIIFNESLTSHDYLYAVWMILFCNHLLNGGLPGEWEVHFLIERYLEPPYYATVHELLDKYRSALSKSSQILRNDPLNEYILFNYDRLFKQFNELKPEKESYFREVKNITF